MYPGDDAALELPAGVSVVVPVYRSSATLPQLVSRLGRVLDQVADSYEILLVDDASPDDSWQTVLALHQADRRHVHGLRLAANAGQHNALLCGIRHARFQIVVTLDDDLQHPPEEIPKLLARLRAGADVVYGVPLHDRHSSWRNLASHATKWALSRLFRIPNAQSISAFRAFRTALRHSFSHHRGRDTNLDVLLTWGTSRFTGLTVRHEPRKEGRSTYTVGKLIRHALNMVLGFGSSAGTYGVALLLGWWLVTALLWAASIVGRGYSPPTLTELLDRLAFAGVLAGTFFQLVVLGLVALRVERLIESQRGKPSYELAEWHPALGIVGAAAAATVSSEPGHDHRAASRVLR